MSYSTDMKTDRSLLVGWSNLKFMTILCNRVIAYLETSNTDSELSFHRYLSRFVSGHSYLLESAFLRLLGSYSDNFPPFDYSKIKNNKYIYMQGIYSIKKIRNKEVIGIYQMGFILRICQCMTFWGWCVYVFISTILHWKYQMVHVQVINCTAFI